MSGGPFHRFHGSGNMQAWMKNRLAVSTPMV
jgi:hypothetical protein